MFGPGNCFDIRCDKNTTAQKEIATCPTFAYKIPPTQAISVATNYCLPLTCFIAPEIQQKVLYAK
jgi:ferredoxin-like protein FixX